MYITKIHITQFIHPTNPIHSFLIELGQKFAIHPNMQHIIYPKTIATNGFIIIFKNKLIIH